MNKIKLLKEELNNRHVSFYTREGGKLKRYDMNTNKKWINDNVDSTWNNPNIDQFISGFDFVSSSFVNVYVENILWDEVNGFSDNAVEYDKQEINKCEDTLKFISGSWNNIMNKRSNASKIFRINKRSEKHKSSSYLSFDGKGINFDAHYEFDDYIGETHYHIFIPCSYIKQHMSKYFNKQYFGLIHEKYILQYIENHVNDVCI